MEKVRRLLPLLIGGCALSVLHVAQAQSALLQGDQGLPGDSGPLTCDGIDCTVNQGLVILGELNVVDGELNGDLDVVGSTLVDSLVSDELSVSETSLMTGCPRGYTLAFSGICEKEVSPGIYDEVVPVGDFWVDRYEASIWETADCGGTPYGQNSGDMDLAGFLDTGNWNVPLYACSVADVDPSAYMTWYQAQQACALSGKTLCANAQWQAAVAGTAVTGCNEGYVCDGLGIWTTGSLDCGGCESHWGAFDMVGNLWEWVSTWLGHPGNNGEVNLFNSEYGEDGYWSGGPTSENMPSVLDDGTWRAQSSGIVGNGDTVGEPFGPAAALRGGQYTSEDDAGHFSFHAGYGPSSSHQYWGTRCCINR